MTDNNLLGPWVRRFLLEHLVGELNLARNTQASYRDALALLLPYAAEEAGQSVDQLAIEHLSVENLRQFLGHLEQGRGCSTATRNQRLAAVHALARFISTRSPEHIAWANQILTIPFKKAGKVTVPYLDKFEMDALLAAVDRRSRQGSRDYALLLFLYNTGARADEVAHVAVANLDLGRSPSVRLQGKGGKSRLCPLWPATVGLLAALVSGREPHQRAFINRCNQPMTRFGVYALVKRCVRRAGQKLPSLLAKRVSPHTIRHTTAVHLLRAGVDINTIRAWLGHVSLDTTNIYAEVDLEMKAKALAHCEVRGSGSARSWHNRPGLMTFLKTLQQPSTRY